MEAQLSTASAPASSTLANIDRIVQEAQSLESLIGALLTAGIPALAPFIPEIDAIINAIASGVHKAASGSPAATPSLTP